MTDPTTTADRPRTFGLIRQHDVTGISGTGRIADGALWPDGSASVRWRGDRPSTVWWVSLADVLHIHGHGGHTRIVWDDEEQPDDPAAEPTDDLDVTPYLVVHRYRPDRGGHAWAVRCWGDGDCDGHLALDLSDRAYAERKAREHLAVEHPTTTLPKEG